MTMEKMKSLSLWLVVGVLGVLGIGSAALALTGNFPIGIESCNNCSFSVGYEVQEDLGEVLGASGTRFPNGLSVDSTSPSAGEIRGTDLTITDDAVVSDDLNVTGDIDAVGTLSYRELTEAITATNTIEIAESGSTYFLSGVTSTQSLPTSTTAGQVYRFYVNASVSGNITIVTSGSENVIDGTLIVAGAVVDCDAEDTLTVVASAENVGDFVELRSDGTRWLIGASGALTSGAITCSAS